MIQQQDPVHKLQNEVLELTLFADQSQNGQLIVGKVTIQPKKFMPSPQLLLQIKGIYRIWDLPKKDPQNSTQSHIDISDTINDIDLIDTKRPDKRKLMKNFNEVLQREEIFMEGEQKITQNDKVQSLQSRRQVLYPFMFNIPYNMPPTQQCIYFAGKRIQIKYYLLLKVTQKDTKNKLVNTQIEIKIRRLNINVEKGSKICKTLQYRCFTRFFCSCLGIYHVELSSTVLHPGRLQVQGRVFREGKTTQKIITSLNIKLYGELKKVKKLLISEKKMVLNQSDYQMFGGQVILGYDSELKSFDSELMTIRFWIECEVQFHSKVWKFLKKETTIDVIL